MPGVAEQILQAPHRLVALDYDGTLTPIVEDATQAILPMRTKKIIEALSSQTDTAVAIVSGRAYADVRDLVGIPNLIYASNHGMEINGPGMSFHHPGAKDSSQALQVLASILAKQLDHVQGAFVENKGLTLSVHYRRVAPGDGEEVWQAVLHAVELVNDRFHVTLGNKVYEIRPLLCWNKGAALTWIKDQLGRRDTLVIYLGDDVTDEDAFAAVGDSGVTIKVGASETTLARFRLPDSSAVYEFLKSVHELLRQEPNATTTPSFICG
jgi:trehalose-phosphatase